jgi:hypothetical protein
VVKQAEVVARHLLLAVDLNDFASPSFTVIRGLLVPHRGWQSNH